MDNLVKYSDDVDSSDELASSPTQPNNNVKANEVTSTSVDLESEWENFEKMLAAGPESTAVPEVDQVVDFLPKESESQLMESKLSKDTPGDSVTAFDSSVEAAVERHPINPYAYLTYLTQSASTSAEQKADAHAKLDAFLEQAAAAAAADMDTESGSDEESSVSGSDRSRSASPKGTLPLEKAGTAASEGSSRDKKANAELKEEHHSKDDSRRKRSRSRSRQRSHSRRSRSRSRGHKHRKHRSSSRSRHGSRRRRHGSKSRRRSSSRHRHRRSSRSPHRRRSSPNRRGSGRHRRGSGRNRRSYSRDRQGSSRRYNGSSDPRARAPPPEDFKARMKRELQQAARDAMSGKSLGDGVTPQQALYQTMAAMHAKAQEITGVSVPKFYNPAAVNPLKYAEQEKKRKLLWSKAKDNKEHSQQMWQGTEVATDEKYRKLMGIKDGEVPTGTEFSEEQHRKQSELFAKLDQEYAMARMNTHTHRGMGLGVVSQMAAASQQQQQSSLKPS